MGLVHALKLMVLAVWAAMTPRYDRAHDANAIAEAIAQAVVEDGAHAPVYSSHAEDAAIMALWGVRESSLNLRAVNDHGRSFGAWQQDARYGGKGSALVQARAWLWMLHQGARICPERPSTIMWGACHARDVLTGRDVAELAAEREAAARDLLTRALRLDDAARDEGHEADEEHDYPERREAAAATHAGARRHRAADAAQHANDT